MSFQAGFFSKQNALHRVAADTVGRPCIKGQVRNSLRPLVGLQTFTGGYCGERGLDFFGRTNGVSSRLGAVGCSSDEAGLRRCKIVVGTEAAYPPFEMIDETGKSQF